VSRVSQVSKRYAKALFEAVSNKEAVLNELRVLVKAFAQDPSILAFFSSHVESDSLKKQIMTKALEGKGVSNDLNQFLVLLAEKGRVSQLSDILNAFEMLVDEQNGVTRGTVRSAVKLDADAKQKIESVVSHFVKKKVILTYSEDSTLVGGVVAQVGGWTFEDTLDSHLRRLKEDLNRRAN
jgi:F-type H+-transporting ATPase subunit delta